MKKKKRARIEWDEGLGVVENARKKLPEFAAEYIAHGDEVATPSASGEELHGLRLATKHFRYTLENFAPVYDPGMDTRLAELRKVQQFLGDINDCQVSRKLLRSRDGGTGMIDFLDQREAQLRSEFLRFWSQKFASPARGRAWNHYLASHVHEPAKHSEKP